MDRQMQNGAIQRMLSTASFDSNVVYKLVAVILLAGLLHKVIFKPKKYKLFPVWAAIEIALTGYIISRGGLSRRI
jgi:hypothetical protein